MSISHSLTVSRTFAAAAVFSALAASVAMADPYPLSGKFAYVRPGLAPDAPCGKEPIMRFTGDRRYDSTGGVHDFVNVSVTRNGGGDFEVIDVFSNGQIRNASTKLTLRVIDDDHADVRLAPSGKQIKLQRCK